MNNKKIKQLAEEIYNNSLWIFEKQSNKTSFYFVEDCYNNIKLNQDITKTIFDKNTNDIENITFYLNKILKILPYELDIVLDQAKEKSLMNLLEASLLLFHTFYPKEFEDLEQKKFQKSLLFAIKISDTLLVQDLCSKYLSEKEKHQVLINDISNLIDKNTINLYNISFLISVVLSLYNLLNTSHLENLKLQLQEIEKDTVSVFDNVNDKFKLLRKIQRLRDFLIFKTDSINDFNQSLSNAHKLFYLPRLSQESCIIVDLKIKEEFKNGYIENNKKRNVGIKKGREFKEKDEIIKLFHQYIVSANSQAEVIDKIYEQADRIINEAIKHKESIGKGKKGILSTNNFKRKAQEYILEHKRERIQKLKKEGNSKDIIKDIIIREYKATNNKKLHDLINDIFNQSPALN